MTSPPLSQFNTARAYQAIGDSRKLLCPVDRAKEWGYHKGMDPTTKAGLVREGGKIASDLVRLFMARPGKGTRAPVVEKEPPPEQKPTITTPATQEISDKPIIAKPGTGCRTCTADHLATCAGSLSEALRFARSDGLSSDEVQKRIALCAQEMNIWERWDATPASFVDLPQADKDFLRRWLPKGRGLRHQLNDITTVEKLEETAAHAERLHLEARKELYSSSEAPFLKEVDRQAKRIKAGEISKEEAIKELEAWEKSAKT